MSDTMVITFPRRELAAALLRLSKTAPKNSPKRVLRSARLTLGGSVAEFNATDCDRAHDERVNALNTENAAALTTLVNVAELKAAAAVGKGSTVAVAVDSAGRISVDGLRLGKQDSVREYPREYSSHKIDAAEFATIGGAIVSADELRRAIALTEFSTDVDSSRFALGGCKLETANGAIGEALNVIATDGRRLSVYRIGGGVESVYNPAADELDAAENEPRTIEPAGAVLPVGACRLLADQVGKRTKAATVCVELLQRQPTAAQLQAAAALGKTAEPIPGAADLIRIGVFDAAGCLLSLVTSRVVEGRYPNWRRHMLNDNAEPRGSVAVAELAAAVKRVALTTDKESRGVQFGFRPRRLFVFNRSANKQRAIVPVSIGAAASEYAAFQVTIDVRYVAEFAKAAAAAGCERIHLSTAGKNRPIELRAAGCVYVVMPMARG